VTLILLLATPLVLVGCGPDRPGSVVPVSEAGLFQPPDTVRVMVLGRVARTDGAMDLQFQPLDPPEEEWLDAHGYVHTRTEIDSSGTQELQKAGVNRLMGQKYYVRGTP
jgi:hypothetical protein